MLELKIKQGRKHVPLFDLPTYLGREKAAREIGDTVESLIAFLDGLEGDPDLESYDAEDDFVLAPKAINTAIERPHTDIETDAAAWVEWDTMKPSQRRQGATVLLGHEDDEEDDDSGQCTEDEISAGIVFGKGSPGCSISDPGGTVDGEAFPSYGLDQSRPRHWQPTDDLRARKPHRDRIRRTRCTKRVTQFGRATYGEYELIV
jgi:hypothetical protein